MQAIEAKHEGACDDQAVEDLRRSLRTRHIQKHRLPSGDVGSKYRGLKVASIDDQGYFALLNDVISAIYASSGIIHGGAVRDLLNGIVPADIDILIPKDLLAYLFDALNAISTYEKTTQATSNSGYDERYRLYLEPLGRTVNSTATTIVLDISAPLWVDFRDMSADFEVNMLYIEKVTGAYGPMHGDMRVIDDHVSPRIVAEWAVVAVREVHNGPALPFDLADDGLIVDQEGTICGGIKPTKLAKYERILEGLRSRTTRVDHVCTKNHIMMTLADKERRAASIEAAGYTDNTEYNCDNPNCRMCSFDVLKKAVMRSLSLLSDTNYEEWRMSLHEIVESKAYMADIASRIRTIVAHHPPDVDDVHEYVFTNVDVVQILKRHLPQIPRIITPSMTSIGDCARMQVSFLHSIGSWHNILGDLKRLLLSAQVSLRLHIIENVSVR